MFTEDIISILKSGGIGVIPTDTLYGIVGSAFSPEAVQRIYNVKKRTPGKPLIVLISSLDDLRDLGVEISDKTIEVLSKIWPGSVSVELPRSDESFSYINPGNILAVRLPKNDNIISLLKKTGPLVAPSANIEGQKPASDINEAREYFGNSVDFYVDGGILSGDPSTLISINNGDITVLRQGRVILK